MNVLIIYHSRTSRTEDLALEIARGAGAVAGAEVVLKPVTEVQTKDFLAADAVIAGSPVYFGTMSSELKKVFDDNVAVRNRMENKIGAAFASSGFHAGGKETTMMSIIQALLIYGMIVVGDPQNASGHYGVAYSGPFGDAAKDHARKLGARVARSALATAELRQAEN
ncbi:MAG: flavodoxin family protein [bacterium]|nr:flavodoxin family protein [bacterium]